VYGQAWDEGIYYYLFYSTTREEYLGRVKINNARIICVDEWELRRIVCEFAGALGCGVCGSEIGCDTHGLWVEKYW
jgi:hypothetical protein